MAFFPAQAILTTPADELPAGVFLLPVYIDAQTLNNLITAAWYGAHFAPHDVDPTTGEEYPTIRHIMPLLEAMAFAGTVPDPEPEWTLDDFNRANGALGADWNSSGNYLNYGGWNAIIIASNQARAANDVYTGALYNAAQFGPNMEVEIELATVVQGEFGLHVRLADAYSDDASGYLIGCLPDAPTFELNIYRLEDNATYILVGTTDGISLQSGDIFGVRLNAGDFEVYRVRAAVETILLSVTDPAPIIRAGDVAFYTNENGFRFDNWRARSM